MADQNITALPVSATPASSDQLLLVGATEEKLIDYDKLADAILNKLTSKSFSLDQGTMPLVSALNQLNSNPLSILTRSAILLEQAFDYNELKTTGAYYLTGSDPALAKNRPADCTNCYMLVFALIPTRVCQIILPGNDDRAWIRSTVTDNSEWRSWVAIF